jgi:SPP1 family predicted phage head-tail adaptor
MKGLFNNTFTPQTVTRTTDSVGGYTEAWTDGTAFRGRMRPLSNSERTSSDKVTVFATHRLYCDASVTLTEADRVTFDSRTFEVRAVRNPSESNHHLEIDLLEVT